MEKELFFSGYCRAVDNSRLVTVIIEDGQLTEVDCGFEHCHHRPNCTVAKGIEEQTK